jgi:hypothetical protein
LGSAFLDAFIFQGVPAARQIPAFWVGRRAIIPKK